MSLLDTAEKISFKQLFWLALILGLLITIPLTVALIQKETKLLSQAKFEPPPAPELTRRTAPTQPPEITLVKPFLGKEGDVVVIEGKNLGFYPEGAYIKINNLAVPENHLLKWEDNAIQFYLPDTAKTGQITVSTGVKTTTYPRIFTVYSTEVKTKITKTKDRLLAANAANISRVVYYDHQNNRFEEKLNRPLTSQDEPQPLINSLQTNDIAWITLFDPQNIPLSFYVSPGDFGF